MKRWIGLWAALLGALAVWGQTPRGGTPVRLPAVPQTLRLNPDSAAQLAVQRNTQVALSEAQIAAARGRLEEALAIRRPRVTGSATYQYKGPGTSLEIPGMPPGHKIEFAPTSMHIESVQVTWPFYTGGRDRWATAAARAGLEAAANVREATIRQIALAARQGVYGILQLEQLVIVAEQRLASVTEHLRIAQAMFEAGTAPRFEVVQAETEQARARGDLIHVRTAVAQAKAALAQLLLVPQETEIVVEEGPPPALPSGERGELIAQALRQRPEIAALEASVRAKEHALRLTEAQYAPSMALIGQLNNQTETAATAGFNWSLTAALNVPIYAGGEKEAKLKQARAELESARLNLESMREQIAREVTQAWLKVQEAQEALAVAEKGEAEARERLRIAQVRFSSGVGLGIEVLDAQTALTAAQTQVVQARYDLQTAIAALRAALGFADLTEGTKERKE